MKKEHMRVLAVDWSGKADGGKDTIWIAEVRDGRLAFLENGRTRDEVVSFLLQEAAGEEPLVVGLDFAFSLPAWYLREHGYLRAPELWARLEDGLAEDILERCEPPFWGRPGKTRPVCEEPLRRTDKLAVGGISPKSVFQIGGAGAVGTGSLRGMPALHRLRAGGMAVWPFTPATRATVIEIYPRLMTGAVNKSSQVERLRYLERWPDLDAPMRGQAASTEDAFDAAVSALVMWAHREELKALPPARDDSDLLEGTIWTPSCAATATCALPGCARTSTTAINASSDWLQHVEALVQAPRTVRIKAARMLLESLEDG